MRGLALYLFSGVQFKRVAVKGVTKNVQVVSKSKDLWTSVLQVLEPHQVYGRPREVLFFHCYGVTQSVSASVLQLLSADRLVNLSPRPSTLRLFRFPSDL